MQAKNVAQEANVKQMPILAIRLVSFEGINIDLLREIDEGQKSNITRGSDEIIE